MRITPLILGACLLAILPPAIAEPVATLRSHIEADFQIDVAVCKELTKKEKPVCLKEADVKRRQAYTETWNKRAPASQTRIYYGDLNINKPKIDKDYKADLAFCKELGKADAATCQREALDRKKLAIRSVMIAPVAASGINAPETK